MDVDRTGKVLGQRYRVTGVLGSGGMGTVYEAQALDGSGRVALKVVHNLRLGQELLTRRALQEALAIAMVHHPNVVRALGSFEDDDGSPVIVMERLEGRSLDRVIAAEGAMAVERACRLAIEAADGIAAAHEKAIIHRDLKPANLFLTVRPDGSAGPLKVLDFGVSRLSDQLTGSQDLPTGAGQFLGTAQYASPEQIEDARSATVRSDVYGLAAILLEMLTGEPPFQGKNFAKVLIEVLQTRAPRARARRPEVPVALDDLIARCLEKDPQARPATMPAFAAEIRALV